MRADADELEALLETKPARKRRRVKLTERDLEAARQRDAELRGGA